MIRRYNRHSAHVLWTIVLVLGSVPFFDLHQHAHWDRIGWIPFSSPPVKAGDIALNVLIYVPFGFLARTSREPGGRHLLLVVGQALALSLALEASQCFTHSRFPSMTDVLCNVAGAVIGAVLFRLTLNRATTIVSRQAGGLFFR